MVLEGRHDEVSANARRCVMVAQVHLDIGSQERVLGRKQRNAMQICKQFGQDGLTWPLEVTGVEEEK